MIQLIIVLLLYTLLATTDPPSAPPENHVIPKTLNIAIPGSCLTVLAIVTVMTKFIFVVSNKSAERDLAKSSQSGPCNQATSQCIVTNYKKLSTNLSLLKQNVLKHLNIHFFSCLSKMFFTLHKLTKQPVTCCSAHMYLGELKL